MTTTTSASKPGLNKLDLVKAFWYKVGNDTPTAEGLTEASQVMMDMLWSAFMTELSFFPKLDSQAGIARRYGQIWEGALAAIKKSSNVDLDRDLWFLFVQRYSAELAAKAWIGRKAVYKEVAPSHG